MINTKRPNTDDYIQVGFIEAKDNQGNYQNIDHIYDSEGNIVFQQGYLNEYDGADDFGIPAIGKPLIDYTIYGNTFQDGVPTPDNPIMPEGTGERTGNLLPEFYATSGEISGNSYTITKNSIETHNDGNVLGAYYVLTEFKRYGNYANYTIIDKKHSFKVPAGTYTFSGNENIHSGNNGLRLIVGQLGQTMAGATGGAQNIGVGQTFTIIEDSYVCPVLEIRSDSRVDEYTLTNPMLNLGSTALPYEPYGYKLDISSGGVNLWDPDSITTNQAGQTQYGVVLPAGIYTIVNSSSASIYCRDGVDSIRATTFANAGETKTVKFNSALVAWTPAKQTQVMLNRGNIPLPYEPYVEPTTTPIYLGEVETTRKIKKLVLTGEERNINKSSSYPGSFYVSGAVPDIKSIRDAAYCSHASYTNLGHYAQNTFCFNGLPININLWFPQFDSSSTTEEFRQYLAAQYAAGTPVTVWYVLVTPTTGIVNEPLMRIGDYADSVDFSQAGVQIPTLKRPNTTVIDITTSLPPSEIYAKYRGSKTQKYDLFLAANGDSFEAKNGQSLYIGDDT